MSIHSFVEQLSKENCGNQVYNQYSDEKVVKALWLYLECISRKNPNILLIGEAAGYNGCRLTGIPFTSEYIITNNIFFTSNITGIDLQKVKPQKESSATIVWNTLESLSFIPLMWNAYPFHPYKKENQKSNRTPTKEELQVGKKYIELLLKEFPGIKIIGAVGNQAYSSLDTMNLPIRKTKIRHPANGGKSDFVEGIEQLIG